METNLNESKGRKNYMPQPRKVAVMSDEEYIKQRLETQIAWYNQKSSFNQKRFKSLKTIEFVIAASIPVVITISALVKTWNLDTAFQIVAALSGVVLVIINKLLDLQEYHKLWKEYRVTCEALEHERLLYLTRTEPYDEEDAFPLLVDKVESILNNERQKWKRIPKPEEVKKEEQKIKVKEEELQHFQ